MSIWSSTTPTTTPNPLGFIRCRNQFGEYEHGNDWYIDVATSSVSTVCRLSIDGDRRFLSADEVAELIARLRAALVILVA